MKALIASSNRGSNPNLRLLVQSITDHPEMESVLHDHALFWQDPHSLDVDILHVNWPEEFFGWSIQEGQDLSALCQQLDRWRERAMIVATVHNFLPHYRDTPISHALYEAVYTRADGFIHRGVTSREDHHARFRALANRGHAIIPSGVFTSFPNDISQAEARAEFGLNEKDRVFLAIGQIRHREEINLVLKGFIALRLKHKRLLFSVNKKNESAERLRRIYGTTLRFYPPVRFDVGFVPQERVQVYMNAADVLVIQRVKPLNSANLSLGFTFGKVVIGADSGVIGEILRETGNPVFDPHSIRSVAAAMKQGVELAARGHGARNRLYAEQNWNWDSLADRHVAFYRTLLAAKR
ncbi:MAG: glycosyltransferase family 4 protein [Burkholderiales bacterium]|nr:glycosyltransferase family 4 protein [Anaerolineae bacterium]